MVKATSGQRSAAYTLGAELWLRIFRSMFLKFGRLLPLGVIEMGSGSILYDIEIYRDVGHASHCKMS